MQIPIHRAVILAGAFMLVGLGLGISLPAAASGPVATPAHRAAPVAAFPHMNHVFLIMMENTSYSNLLSSGNTNTRYIRKLAHTFGLATNYYGVTHTSLPNYVATTSGSNWGANQDNEAMADQGYFDHLSLFDELDQAGVSWAGYMESMPSTGYAGNYGDCTSSAGSDPTCSAGGDTGTALYVRKHNPFMQYPDIFKDPRRAHHVAPLTQLTRRLHSGRVAQFVWISPNICDDMHGGAPQCPYASSPSDQKQATLYQDGNTFLRTWVKAIVHSKAWTGNSTIFVTWDEAGYEDAAPYGPTDDTGCCDSPVLPAVPPNPTTAAGGDLVGGTLYAGGHVPMIVIARHGARHAVDSTPSNHYSLLQTVERNWDIPLLGNTGDTIQVHSLAPLLRP